MCRPCPCPCCLPPWRMAAMALAMPLLLALPRPGWAQPPALDWQWVGGAPAHLRPPAARRLRTARDAAAAARALAPWVGRQQARGWADLAIDSIRLAGTPAGRLRIACYAGPRYALAGVEIQGLPAAMARQHGLAPAAAYDAARLRAALLATLRHYQRTGHPLARFDSLRLRPLAPALPAPAHAPATPLALGGRFSPGPLVRIDSVKWQGNKRETDRFAAALAGVQPGDLFDQQAIDNLPRQLNNSPYFQQARVVRVRFKRQHTAVVEVSVARRQANKFDVLLGLLPPNDSLARFSFTGHADLVLVSPFRAGEILQFKFVKLVANAQQISLQAEKPYIGGTPLRAAAALDILQQAPEFMNVAFKGGGGYAFSPFLTATAAYRSRSARLLDPAPYLATPAALAQRLDGTQRLAEVGFAYEKLDQKISPTRGISAQAALSNGQRILVRNPLILNELPRFYDTLPESVPSREAEARAAAYARIGRRGVLHLAARSFWLLQTHVYQNDQRQVGGGRSLRGFNENQFFADGMAQLTAEYRLLLERNSFLALFADAAYLRDRVLGRQLLPLGTGIALQYETKAGILSVTYAVGRVGDQPFMPSRGKIHIGLANRF